MKDGSILKGKVLRQENNTLTLKTSYAGILKIKGNEIKKLQSDEPLTIMLVTGELIQTHSISNIADGVSQIKKIQDDWKTSFKTKNVAYINPEPWRLNQGFKTSGKVNISLKSQHGNTIKDEFEIDGRLEFRSLTDRYTFTGQLENDNSRGKTTADNWLFRSKYDFFVSQKRYYGLETSFERDKFTDLKLRTVVGPHIGHQFYESNDRNLQAEVGLAKVFENLIEADNTDYVALNWYVNYDQYFFDKTTQFYHEQNGIWNLEDTDKMTLTSWTGFRFPLRSGFVASAELEWEFDNEPAESVHQTDTTYRLKLGYQW